VDLARRLMADSFSTTPQQAAPGFTCRPAHPDRARSTSCIEDVARQYVPSCLARATGRVSRVEAGRTDVRGAPRGKSWSELAPTPFSLDQFSERVISNPSGAHRRHAPPPCLVRQPHSWCTYHQYERTRRLTTASTRVSHGDRLPWYAPEPRTPQSSTRSPANCEASSRA